MMNFNIFDESNFHSVANSFEQKISKRLRKMNQILQKITMICVEKLCTIYVFVLVEIPPRKLRKLRV